MSGVLCEIIMKVKIKGKVYKTIVKPAMVYGAETRPVKKAHEKKMEVRGGAMSIGVQGSRRRGRPNFGATTDDRRPTTDDRRPTTDDRRPPTTNGPTDHKLIAHAVTETAVPRHGIAQLSHFHQLAVRG